MTPKHKKIIRDLLHDKAFTLIELLVVISIIALLSSVVLASLAEAKLKASVVRDVQSAMQIANALELYKSSNNGYYPVTASTTAPFSDSIVASSAFQTYLQPYIKLSSISNPQSALYFSSSTVTNYACGSQQNLVNYPDYILYFSIPPGQTLNMKKFYNGPATPVPDTYCITNK